MKNLKVTDEMHDRISEDADTTPFKLQEFTDTILNHALSKFEAGQITLVPATAVETPGRPVPQDGSAEGERREA